MSHALAADIIIPSRMRKLPRYQGMPIPYTTWIDPKTRIPDFKVNDEELRQKVIRFHRCALCGEKHTAQIAFIGGPASIEHSSLFVDGGMHVGCAQFAWTVCPYIVYGKGHSGHQKDHSAHGELAILGAIPTAPPERMGMLITDGYSIYFSKDNYMAVKANKPPISILWREFSR